MMMIMILGMVALLPVLSKLCMIAQPFLLMVLLHVFQLVEIVITNLQNQKLVMMGIKIQEMDAQVLAQLNLQTMVATTH